ncbi:MAG: 16S rRNA (cytosine(967)-C(5))-methyltransferase RsmB [Sideroxydans sp.]|nr:16S rRNA (cytosine(967)-C(5))-methyltransferase RsmB [Sideroxydans sp.]
MQNVQLEAISVINSVLQQGRNLTQVLSESLRINGDFSPQQRGALQDLCYGTLRFNGQLAFVVNQLVARPPKEILLTYLLQVAIYQLEYTKAGSHVIVDQAVRASKRINPNAGGLVNGVLRNFQRNRDALLVAASKDEVAHYSYPQWWINAVRRQYAKRANAVLEAGNQHPPMTLRVNIHKTTRANYLALLQEQGIGASPIGPDALMLEIPVGVDRLPHFNEGWVSVQDSGAQFAARLLDVKKGMRVLDACAAPGGKSAHLLESADIHLVAMDKDEHRLQRVEENLTRLGLKAELVCGDAENPQTWWDGKLFHRILADVPCSASGVVRRHPDIKWLRRSVDIAGFAKQQSNILEALWALLAVDGKMLYATCSIFEQENQQVIERFLLKHAEAIQLPLTELPQGQLLPDDQHDGFFYALLHKIPN